LLESVVAVALLVTVLSAAVHGVAAGSKATRTVHTVNTAQNIARSQMEYTLDDTYCAPPCSYPTINAPTGYTITAQAEAYPGGDENLQYVVVTVYRGGEALARMRGIKVNR
jgi:hypothetical protein